MEKEKSRAEKEKFQRQNYRTILPIEKGKLLPILLVSKTYPMVCLIVRLARW